MPVLTIRVGSVVKQDLERAARTTGRSLSAFVLEAAQKSAAKVPQDPPRAKVSRGVPVYFRVACETARLGGPGAYRNAGALLADHVYRGRLVPSGRAKSAWLENVNGMYAMMHEGRWDDALAWWDEHFPPCMELVPPRRRATFIEGVYATLGEAHGWRSPRR